MKRILLLLGIYTILVTGCTTVYKADQKRTTANRMAILPADAIRQKQQAGIDFIANGNDPVAWTLSLDLEKTFSFEPAGGRTLITSPAMPVKPAGSNETVYETSTDIGQMKVIIYPESCTGNQKKVAVTVNGKHYSGCGAYLYNYLLNDIWILDSIGNKELAPADYQKQKPVLEFNLVKNNMNGYDGCNNISSDILVEGDHIKFSSFTGTKKTCSTAAAKLFNSMLAGQTIDYSISEGKLILHLIDDSRLLFKKSE